MKFIGIQARVMYEDRNEDGQVTRQMHSNLVNIFAPSMTPTVRKWFEKTFTYKEAEETDG